MKRPKFRNNILSNNNNNSSTASLTPIGSLKGAQKLITERKAPTPDLPKNQNEDFQSIPPPSNPNDLFPSSFLNINNIINKSGSPNGITAPQLPTSPSQLAKIKQKATNLSTKKLAQLPEKVPNDPKNEKTVEITDNTTDIAPVPQQQENNEAKSPVVETTPDFSSSALFFHLAAPAKEKEQKPQQNTAVDNNKNRKTSVNSTIMSTSPKKGGRINNVVSSATTNTNSQHSQSYGNLNQGTTSSQTSRFMGRKGSSPATTTATSTSQSPSTSTSPSRLRNPPVTSKLTFLSNSKNPMPKSPTHHDFSPMSSPNKLRPNSPEKGVLDEKQGF